MTTKSKLNWRKNKLDINADGPYSKQATLFKTLRRLHGQNLENQGLNNLTEAFQNFMTRAKYFSIGRIRRTWSHSAVEFLKYRRLLPMLTSEDDQGDSFTDDFAVATTSWYDENDDVFGCDPALSKVEASEKANKKGEKRILVTNISPRVTSIQLISFFSKFGKVAVCQIPAEEKRQSVYASVPNRSRNTLTAQIKFRKVEDAQRALKASEEELKFYDRIMAVSEYGSSKKRSFGCLTDSENGGLNMKILGSSDMNNPCRTSPSSVENSSVLTITELNSPLNQQFGIYSLPTKVLARILYYLSPLDRIRIERVNKSFLEAAAKAWTMNTSLSFGSDRVISRFFNTQNPMRNTHLRAFLVKCGIHLRTLDLSGINNLLDGRTFGIISSMCPKLREINMSGLTADSRTLRAFSDALPHLSSVTYVDMVSVGDRSMWNLFRGNGASMRKIDLRGCRRIKGRCLRSFSTNLEHVLLDGCSRLDDISIEDLCLRSPNVKVLSLSGCFGISDESIGLITRCMSDLESLSLCGDGFKSITPSGLLTLSRFTALTELKLDYNSAVSNELLDSICVPDSLLRTLSIAFAGSDVAVTEDALIGIAKLKRLESLDLSSLAAGTNNVVREVCSKCSKLRTLRLRSCTYLADEGVSATTKLSHLELLDLSGCILVTNVAIQALLDAFPVRKETALKENAVVSAVTVVIGGTICQVSGLRTLGSRVVLDFSDYSALFSNAARRHLYYHPEEIDDVNCSEEELSGDEFQAINAHRAFVIEAQEDEEDLSSSDNGQSIREWAEREAHNLGLLK